MAEENRLFQVEIITPDRVFYTGEGLPLPPVRSECIKSIFRSRPC